ncbi:MAG TPA: hypothetical protein VLC09_16850 [Polyangiaceae bacterium]|nr:hypothetical protein [Polyangiaceae bacterium]
MSGEVQRIYFVPGMFGFGQLAGYDYFQHVRRELETHYQRHGLAVSFVDVPAPPTSSLRERARILCTTISHSAGSAGPIHIVGHSTGGLDARLVLSPGSNLKLPRELLAFRARVQSLVTIDTPHYGTPLASYFATVSGARLLYALSLLTVVSLKLGEPSLAIFSRLLAGIGGIDTVFGGDMRMFSRVTDTILRFVDRDRRGEITDYLSKVLVDQGAILQISPEAMDLFNAAVTNAENVRYGSIAAASPKPTSLRAARRVRSPYMAFTAALYTTLYQFAAQPRERYGYAVPNHVELAQLRRFIEHDVSAEDNDGIVPTLSMLWGELIWVVEADHLDTLGHFHDDQRPAVHTDWLTSGARMTRESFARMVKSIADFQLPP